MVKSCGVGSMKRIVLFGIIMVFLVGIVSAANELSIKSVNIGAGGPTGKMVQGVPQMDAGKNIDVIANVENKALLDIKDVVLTLTLKQGTTSITGASAAKDIAIGKTESFSKTITVPTQVQGGDYVLTLKAEGTHAGAKVSASQDFPIKVVSTVTLPPVATSTNPKINTVADVTLPENSKVVVTVTSTAADSGSIIFTSDFASLQRVFQDATSARFEWQTGLNDASSREVTFTAGDGNSFTTAKARITITNVNGNPSASASADKTTARINETITLRGSGTDPDGDSIAAYSWRQHSGPAIQLSDSNAQNPTFVARELGTYIFNLTVRDSNSAVSSASQVTVTVSDSNELTLIDLDIRVGGKTDGNIQDEQNGYTISERAKSGDKVKIDANVENRFPNNGPDIENVFMTVTIRDIDDNDDLEEETDEEDIRPGNDQSFDIEFTVPTKVDDQSYDIIIVIEGRDQNRKVHRIEKRFQLDIDKESHDLQINRAELRQSTLACTRNTESGVSAINYGRQEEEEIRFTVKNADLGLDYEKFDDGDITLDTGTDDDAEIAFSVPISATNAKKGSYPIEVSLYRDTDRLEDTSTVVLIVEDCSNGEEADEGKEVTTQKPEQKDVDVVVKSGEQDTATPQTAKQFPVLAQVKEDKPFTESPLYTALLA